MALISENIPFKQSTLGKAIRTAYQALVPTIGFVGYILSIPELRDAANGSLPWSMAIIPIAAGILSYVQNKKGL